MDVLRQTNIYTSLEEALTDRNVVCGTGMPFEMHRKRKKLPDETMYVEPRLFFDKLILSKNNEQASNDQKIRLALIFGDERTGKLNLRLHLSFVSQLHFCLASSRRTNTVLTPLSQACRNQT